MDIVWRSAVAAGILALSACAAPRPAPDHAKVQVAPDLVLAMPSPADLGRSVEAIQLVVARYGDRTITFEARISAAPDRFDLVCLDPLGRKAMSIHWTAGTIQAEKASWVPDDLRPENMLADIVMLYWPEKVVQRALAGSGGVLTADTRTRSIRGRQDEAIRIAFPAGGDDRWNAQATYRNLAWNYTLDIQSQVLGP